MFSCKSTVFAVLFTLTAMISAASGTALAAEQTAPPILSVDGQGTGTVTPDQATVTIGITSHAAHAGQAQNDNAWTSNQIAQAIKALGIDAKDIQTGNYSFQPTYRKEESRRNEIDGYTVSHSMNVVVRDIHRTGKVIDAALQAGANEIHSLEFTASDAHSARSTALSNAVQDARGKASIIAKCLGKRIIGIQNVSESSGYLESRRFGNTMIMAAKDAAADTLIEPGNLSLTARVHIDFLIGD